ncbi:MAG: GNAT family N-acetyltransferase, partial [Ilumatobacteraceae bacterium]
AVAGTHVLSDDHGVAAIGGVFTIEEYRGRGYARMLTSAVASTLLDRVTTIGLNVATSNVAARAVYESLGFSAVLSYEETELGEHR